jgi:hypothetical protein
MDTDGCKAAFPESELNRALPEKLLGLFVPLIPLSFPLPVSFVLHQAY